MDIGTRLRVFREHKKLSQGDIEKRTGLLRVYISRVENGHVVPSVETLEKFARALEVPIYQLFYDGAAPKPSEQKIENLLAWNDSRRARKFARQFLRLLGRMGEGNRSLLLALAQWMANSDRGKQSAQTGSNS